MSDSDVEFQQIYVRVSRTTLDALEAAVYVRRLRSAQELVGPIVEALGEKLAAAPDVAAALKSRRDRDAEIAVGAVTPSQRRGPKGAAR